MLLPGISLLHAKKLAGIQYKMDRADLVGLMRARPVCPFLADVAEPLSKEDVNLTPGEKLSCRLPQVECSEQTQL